MAYRGVAAGDAGISERAINLFRQTAPWTRFVSIMMFIGAGLMAIGGIAMASMWVITKGSSGAPGVIGIGGALYFVMGTLYLAPAIYLTRFTNAVGKLLRTRGSTELEQALAGQKSFWKFVGIAIIVVIAAYLVFIMAIVFKLVHF